MCVWGGGGGGGGGLDENHQNSHNENDLHIGDYKIEKNAVHPKKQCFCVRGGL